ncbi:MAG: hypothetical protein KDA86_27415 [Planctomycetaceae bacterium]|nr:hypothetical protein [Planctomycetaceae bacterium]
MRKKDPTAICNQFKSEMDSFIKFRSDLVSCAGSASNQSHLAAIVFHRAFVSLESYLSAWFVAAINRDSTQFLAHRESKIRDLVKSEISAWDENKLTYSPPIHISVSDLTVLVDPDEKNLTFYDHPDMQKKAAKWLSPAYKAKVDSIKFPLPNIYRAAKTIRNCIAHQSKSSFDAMNTTLNALPNTGVCGQLRNHVNSVNNVGSHLKAVFNGKTRTEIYLEQFKKIADQLK